MTETTRTFATQAEADVANRLSAQRDWLVPPPCPATASPAAAPVAADPLVYVEQLLREVTMPAPAPSSAPAFAVTGRTVYLEIDGQQTVTFREPGTPLGDLTVTATSERIQVDWGDGTVGDYPSLGGPWPDGDVTHVYADTGTVDITVRQEWTAAWQLGSAAGTIPDPLESIGTLPAFEIRQLQAVTQ